MAVSIAVSAFTLSWTHTIEKTQWVERWSVAADRLVLEEASVEGSGAGMEPPAGAMLVDGAYRWGPNQVQEEIVLRRDPHAGDWTLCVGDRCGGLGDWLGRDADPVTLRPAGELGCEPS